MLFDLFRKITVLGDFSWQWTLSEVSEGIVCVC